MSNGTVSMLKQKNHEIKRAYSSIARNIITKEGIMAGFSKEELKRHYDVAQREQAIRNGKAVMHDGAYVTQEEINELKDLGQRLAAEGEKGERVYLDDMRCITVCAIEALTPAQIVVAAQDKQSGQVQSPVQSTIPQPLRVAARVPAQP